MAIELIWHDEAKSIICENYQGQWTWEDYFAMSAALVEMMKSVDHRVDIVANMKEGTMPRSGASMTFAKKAMTSLPPNWGRMVIVTNPFIRALTSIFKKFDSQLGSKILTADTVEKAYQVIAEERAKMPVSQP